MSSINGALADSQPPGIAPSAETTTRKHLRHARATPLASIFGSGFLVIVPILNAAVGPYAVVAMLIVCGLAYAMGSVIRFNIRHAEPLLETATASARVNRYERTANLASPGWTIARPRRMIANCTILLSFRTDTYSRSPLLRFQCHEGAPVIW